jgi:hypothetical protein
MRALLALILVTFAAQSVSAATVFLGPSPYLSAADSPFDLTELGSTFFLEDFEDGELNTPGIEQYGNPANFAIVRPPSTLTDSVDADDGFLDGSGHSGNSLQVTLAATFPPLTADSLSLEFDVTALGFIPTAFGFVWTDGTPDSSIRMTVFDESRNVVASHYFGDPLFGDLGDQRFDGTTAEDRFFGVVNPDGFYAVGITSYFVDERQEAFELDHVQYGLAVPEPDSASLAFPFVLGLIASFFITTCNRD